ncbi:MAG: ABC transporter substrate-binding protein [Rhizobiaceae bacterium]
MWVQYIAPQYSTLLSFQPDTFPKISPDLAKEWSVSSDGLRYSFTLNSGVKFHDGTELTADDVKATFERIANPPTGVVSVRKDRFKVLKSIDVTAPDKIDFVLSEPSAGFLATLAAPWNCIYSAKKLKDDPSYPAKTIMGSGPFVFEEFVPGASWKAKKFADYFEKGLPYLDGIDFAIMGSPAIVNAIASEQIDGYMRLITAPDRKRIEDARGDTVKFDRTPSTSVNMVQVNTTRKPLDDVRVRQALNLAIDRKAGLKALGVYAQDGENVIFREGHAAALTGDDLRKVPGYSDDVAAQREQAKKLLADAGVKDLKLSLLAPNIKAPYEPMGIFLIDQWRQIGVTVTLDQQPIANQSARMAAGDFDLSMDFSAPTTDDLTDVLAKWVPGGDGNFSGLKDDELVALFRKQDTVLDEGERLKIARQFLDRFVQLQYALTTFGTYREVVFDKKVNGWKNPPSYAVGLDLKTMWLQK